LNRRVLIFLILAAWLAGSPALAADQPSAQSAAKPSAPALTATQIVERNVAARGGPEAWRKIQTLSMSGTMDAGKARKINPKDYAAGHKPKLGPDKRPLDESTLVQVPFVMQYKRPLKSRVQIEFKGQSAIQVYDGRQGYKLRPYLNRHDWESYNAEELRQAAVEQELDGPLIDCLSKGTKVVAEGVEPVEGREAYRLALTFKNGQSRHVWVDTQSFLEVQVDGTRRVDGKPRSMWTVMRDYKSINGLLIPHLMETRVDGIPGSEKIAVEKVALNPALDDALFARPK